MKKKKYIMAGIAVLLLAIGLMALGRNLLRRQNSRCEKPLKFGATYMTMNNPYFTALNDSIREIVEANGDILITRDPAQNQERQNQQILEMVDDGIVALFVNPVDWENITPALKACQDAGVAVFNVDTNVKDTKYVQAVIQSDNYQAGVQCAQDMMSKKASAKIVVMNHYNIRSTTLRVKGFLDTIQGHPEYKVVVQKRTTSELEVSMDVMNDILKEDADFDVVLGGNDPTALGALAALQLNQVKKPCLIYGIDGSPDAKAMIKQGYLEGTSAQRPIEMGRTAAQVAYDYLEGEQIPKNIVVEVTLITKDNLADFDIDGWQ